MPASRVCALSLLLPVALHAAEPPSFTREIAPLFQSKCLTCHAGSRTRADLNLASRAGLHTGGTSGAVIKPGKASASLLYQHLRDHKMPPRQPLSSAQIDLVRRWIDAGAKWEGGDLKPITVAAERRAGADWWSLQPIRRPAIPQVKHAARARTPIDALLLEKLEAKGLSFAPEADRATLIRRLSFDLLGLAPTPEEIDAFVGDPRPDAYERLVDRLLASPHHGERYGRHWLDVVRFAESHGYEMNTLRPNAWPYRDYIIRAFNQDISFRQFVHEQLAGDLLGTKDFLTQAATGFLVAGPHDMVGNETVEGKRQQRADDLFDMVSTTSATFLGLTVGCARCHDHKFDPISQKDYYALQGLFAGVEHAEREPFVPAGNKPAISARQNVERLRPIAARWVRFTVLATFDGLEPCIDELEVYGPDSADNLALASRGVKASASSIYPNSDLHKLEHVNDGRVGNARSWISAERGKGWVQLELPREATIDRIIWGRDREERYRDRLPRIYRIEVSRDGKTWHTVAGAEGALTPPIKIYAGTFRTPDQVHLLRRGDVMQPLEVVGPGILTRVAPARTIPATTSDRDRRLALSDWLCQPENPLPARVMVNRIWQAHFGQGIVRTPSDFGFNGDRPSHPELLDWLAAEYQATGTLKQLHRLIVLSSAYRQSSRAEERGSSIDSENRLLWRYTPRRLEAEAIRDSLLQTAGALDTAMSGPGYHLWEYSGYVILFKPRTVLGPTEFRRMVYQFKPRLQQDGTFGAFDCPDATAAQPRRNISTTALQALNLLNDPFVLDQAERFAARVERDVGTDRREQVRRAFRLAFGRMPEAIEESAGIKLVERHGLALLCRALVNANEFVFVR